MISVKKIQIIKRVSMTTVKKIQRTRKRRVSTAMVMKSHKNKRNKVGMDMDTAMVIKKNIKTLLWFFLNIQMPKEFQMLF